MMICQSLAACIIGRGERLTHLSRLIRRQLSGSKAYSISSTNMNKYLDTTVLHCIHQKSTKVGVYREIVFVTEQRHVGGSSTVDDGMTTTCSVAQRLDISKRPSDNRKIWIIYITYSMSITHQSNDNKAFVEKDIKDIATEKTRGT